MGGRELIILPLRIVEKETYCMQHIIAFAHIVRETQTTPIYNRSAV